MAGAESVTPGGTGAQPWWLLLLRWSIFAVTAVGIGVGLITSYDSVQNPPLVVAAFAYTGVGMLLTGRRPDNALGWVFLATGLTMGLVGLIVPLDAAAKTSPLPLPWYVLVAATANDVIWPLLLCLLTVWPLMLFPSGHVSRRMRPALWASIVGLGAMMLATALQPTISWSDSKRVIENPLSPSFMAGFGNAEDSTLSSVFGLVLVACGGLAIGSIILRFRRSQGIERLQLRWFVFAAVSVLVVFVLGNVFPDSMPESIGNVVMAVAVAFIPVSCGIAILRYRLYDIDRIISRTASYAVVTGALVLIYAAIVTSATRLVGSTSTLTVAAATLAAAALFRPLLTRVQRVVDRRFNREKVDAQAAVSEFGARLSDEVHDTHAARELIDVTRRVLQPSQAALWLNADPR